MSLEESYHLDPIQELTNPSWLCLRLIGILGELLISNPVQTPWQISNWVNQLQNLTQQMVFRPFNGSFGDFKVILSSICIQFKPGLYSDNSEKILKLFSGISTPEFVQYFQYSSKDFILKCDLLYKDNF